MERTSTGSLETPRNRARSCSDPLWQLTKSALYTSQAKPMSKNAAKLHPRWSFFSCRFAEKIGIPSLKTTKT